MESDAAYFARRANEELLAASGAEHPNARRSHLAMAARYHDIAREIRAYDCLLHVDHAKMTMPGTCDATDRRESILL